MIPGLTGSLLSHEVVARDLPPDPDIRRVAEKLRACHAGAAMELGPSSTARAVFDRLAEPLLRCLGFHVVLAETRSGSFVHATVVAGGRVVAALVVTPWGLDPSGAWVESVRLGIARGARWGLCMTGAVVRVVDVTRSYSRRYVQFDLETATRDPVAAAALCALLGAGAFRAGETDTLDRLVVASERFRAEVRSALQDGVLEALGDLLAAFSRARGRRGRGRDPEALLDESLVVIYRMLFLLFAEARGLVPTWHPVFRESYTIESLRQPIERSARPPGVWESLQAIARLAHEGCQAGTLRVPPFNGRLFSPQHAPLAESVALDDRAVRQAMLALTTRNGAAGRHRIAYGDLGVEQLGGVYERVLDYTPSAAGHRDLALVRAGRRKATGTFYTPRTLTEFVVRRTLAPLVAGRDASEILSLRVLDPSMGSGAFLVAACRYLASAYEAALIREGLWSAFDVTDADRAGFRRSIAQRCLFGVDINPMAVQLGRLSLWLATLAADRPLTFLDHHLRSGNSLVGASPDDVARQPPGRQRRRPAPSLPLFDRDALGHVLGTIVLPRLSLATDPGDTLAQVRHKEQLLHSIEDDGGLARWKTVANVWCAEWFRARPSLTSGAFRAVADAVFGRSGARLPAGLASSVLAEAHAIATRERFFHWQLEFPEVFYEPDGTPAARGGFDAVIGNPPWEMLRGDRGSCDDAGNLTAFTRESGAYPFHGDGHANLYQLFAERALGLVREEGRLGLVLPAGFATDHGCSALRRAVLDRTSTDTFVIVENRDGLFPIHRAVKFVLFAATKGTPTTVIPLRSGVRAPDVLDRLPDTPDDGAVAIPRSLVQQLTGDAHAIPDLRTPLDLAIVSRIAFSVPALHDERGWNVEFGRELNATDDRPHFTRPSAPGRLCPIIEGKQIAPFAVDLGASRCAIRRRDAARLLGNAFQRPRVAYRDVASASNRLTLIAALLPPETVSTHTIFCLKSEVDLAIQEFLCGVFNSFVANYLVRLRVNTHVTVAIVERLPVPRPPLDSAEFARIASMSRLMTRSPDPAIAARLQACVAELYDCTEPEFRHILESFPLVPEAERTAALNAFARANRRGPATLPSR